MGQGPVHGDRQGLVVQLFQVARLRVTGLTTGSTSSFLAAAASQRVRMIGTVLRLAAATATAAAARRSGSLLLLIGIA